MFVLSHHSGAKPAELPSALRMSPGAQGQLLDLTGPGSCVGHNGHDAFDSR